MSDKNNELKTPYRGKSGGYNSATLTAKRNRKRLEAEARQKEHDILTIREKLEKAWSRGGSNKEVSRLMKLAEADGVSVNPPTPEPVIADSKPKAVKKSTKRATEKVAKKKVAKKSAE
jgi:hypothetical protein